MPTELSGCPSALGFCPVRPGADEYAVRSPLFRKTVIHFEKGTTVGIDAPEKCPALLCRQNAPQRVVSERPFVSYSELLKGAKARFEMKDISDKSTAR